jgi:hypothetical protein
MLLQDFFKQQNGKNSPEGGLEFFLKKNLDVRNTFAAPHNEDLWGCSGCFAMMTLSIESGHENSESSSIFVFHYLFITFHNFYLHLITTTSTQAP